MYKVLSFLLLIGFSVQAQKFDKTLEENFKVNSDVTLTVNTDRTDISIETWNKNEVSIEAHIEVEGLNEEEARKILDNWKFKAEGTKSNVIVSTISDILYFTDHATGNPLEVHISHVVVPEMQFLNFEMPKIPEMPEVLELLELQELPEMPEAPEMPEMPEMPEIPDMDQFEFDYELYKEDSTYLKKYKIKIANQVKVFKNSEWKHKMDSFKNSELYKAKVEEMKRYGEEIALKLQESDYIMKIKAMKDSDEFKASIEEAKRAAKEMKAQMLENKELWKEHAKLAEKAAKQADIAVMQLEKSMHDSISKGGQNVYYVSSDKESLKLKINKFIKIKVPKNAAFDLNVRHGKLNIPSSTNKMSAIISYGNFVAGTIEGQDNELKLTNSPVVIDVLQAGNITLKNVPNALLGSIGYSKVFANSSDVLIEEVGVDVALSQKFGNLRVASLSSNFKTLNVVLDYCKAELNLSEADYIYQINSKETKLEASDQLSETNSKTLDDVKSSEGYHKSKTASNKLFLTGVYSTINLN
jgi:hypothetical protein